MTTFADRIYGGIMGLLIGDALGVPYEFRPPEDIPEKPLIEMDPPKNFTPAHLGVPAGTWSDDGAQALCLLESLLRCDEFDPRDFADLLVNWLERGHNAVDHIVFDVGTTSQMAIARLQKGVRPLDAGLKTERDNGNGSLMRVLPLALFHRGTDAELARDSMLQSSITHAHAQSKVCCALYSILARKLLREAVEPWQEAVSTVRQTCAYDPGLSEELEKIMHRNEPPGGSGYVVDSLYSALWCLEQGTYEDVIKAAIGLGYDTDTTAAIAGGLAGVRDGLRAIPQRWQKELRGQEIVKPLLSKFVETIVAAQNN